MRGPVSRELTRERDRHLESPLTPMCTDTHTHIHRARAGPSPEKGTCILRVTQQLSGSTQHKGSQLPSDEAAPQTHSSRQDQRPVSPSRTASISTGTRNPPKHFASLANLFPTSEIPANTGCCFLLPLKDPSLSTHHMNSGLVPWLGWKPHFSPGISGQAQLGPMR